jgi:hypothetical protein
MLRAYSILPEATNAVRFCRPGHWALPAPRATAHLLDHSDDMRRQHARARQSARVDAPLKRSRKGRCSRCWTRVLCSRVSSFTVHASRASVPTSGGKRRPFLWAREENWVRDRGPLINLMRRRCGIWSLVSRGQGLEYAAIRVLDLKPRPFRCIAARRGLRRCACRKGDCSKSRWLCFLPACG